MVGRIGANSGLLRVLGRALWRKESQECLRPRMLWPNPAHHVIRPAAATAIPRSLLLGRCGDRVRADDVHLSKMAQIGVPR